MIPVGKLAYFRGRLTNRIHAMVLEQYDHLSKAGKINKTLLAKRIGREPAQITRWIGAPGNWTIETISDLLLAMGCEPSITVKPLDSENVKHTHVELIASGSTAETAKVFQMWPEANDAKGLPMLKVIAGADRRISCG